VPLLFFFFLLFLASSFDSSGCSGPCLDPHIILPAQEAVECGWTLELMPERMPDRMPAYMPERLTERLQDIYVK